jgi:hypothetical protein
MEGTMLRTLIASVLISGLTYGAASAKVISPDLDQQITMEKTVTTNNLSGVRALTGLNPNRKIQNGERRDRRRAYVSIHHFDTT